MRHHHVRRHQRGRGSGQPRPRQGHPLQAGRRPALLQVRRPARGRGARPKEGRRPPQSQSPDHNEDQRHLD